ncbi:MAG: sialidase family protein [Verrucomicrobiota bacterium]
MNARLLLPLLASLPLLAAEPPKDFGPLNTYNAVTMPDGTLESFHRRALDGKVHIFRQRSTDNGATWSEKETAHLLSVEPWGGPIPLLAKNGELHFVVTKLRGDGRKPNVSRFIDLYHLSSTDGRTKWTEPQRIYEGYCGSLQGVFQLKSGRILVPFADWLPNVPSTPPSGPSVTTCVYSDDLGKTWKRSEAKLTAPCNDGFNGANYGACEPVLIQLKDGRVWMLIRTQDGALYESYSKDGAEWSDAQPSRFHSSNSPAYLVRLKDGRIVVFWNNAEHCERVGKDGVYSGRDALHAAISRDEGETWRGFREVYRDPTRNASPPKDGDRGTAYPHATLADKGRKIYLVSGQGSSLRHRFLIDPEWLMETTQTEDFSKGIDAWHLYKGVGKPERWWRDRVQGPQLIPHPDKPDAKVLHIRRPDDNEPDGATWNFPAGVFGKITLRIKAQEGFAGGQVSLGDRMFDPCDNTGDNLACHKLTLPIKPGKWHELTLEWSGEYCVSTLDGEILDTAEASFAYPNGLSYLRLRSTATSKDPAGFLVESVKAEVTHP